MFSFIQKTRNLALRSKRFFNYSKLFVVRIHSVIANPPNITNALLNKTCGRYFHQCTYLLTLQNCEKEDNKTPVDKNRISHSSLLAALQTCSSAEQQIQVFNSVTKLPSEEVVHRQELCKLLNDVLQPYFPNCTVLLTGSSISGLGLKGCDVDMIFQHPSQVTTTATKKYLVAAIDSGEIPLSEVVTLSPRHQLRYIRFVLRKNSNFKEPLEIIPSPHCPLLSFMYQKLQCDLSNDNRSAVHGTNLMKICDKLDSRVANLYRIIVYWAKHSKLVGGPVKFKSYGIFLLLLYYLQTRNPPVLPTVQEIFNKLGKADDWSSVISNNLNFEASENKESTEELLRGFFFFYLNFDFSWIICPLSGDLIHKNSVLKTDEFKVSTISVLDPLKDHWNVTFGLNFKYSKTFLLELIKICGFYHNHQMWLPQSNIWGLASLICSTSYANPQDKENFMSFHIKLDDLKRNSLKTLSEQELLNESINHIVNVFNNGLLFNCEVTHKDVLNNEKNINNCDEEPIVSNATQTMVLLNTAILCHVKNTWFGRSNWEKGCNPRSNEKNILDVERDISNKVLDLKKNEADSVSLFCEFFTMKNQDDTELIVTLKPLQGTISRSFSTFLIDYVPKIVKRLFLYDSKGLYFLLKKNTRDTFLVWIASIDNAF